MRTPGGRRAFPRKWKDLVEKARGSRAWGCERAGAAAGGRATTLESLQAPVRVASTPRRHGRLQAGAYSARRERLEPREPLQRLVRCRPEPGGPRGGEARRAGSARYSAGWAVRGSAIGSGARPRRHPSSHLRAPGEHRYLAQPLSSSLLCSWRSGRSVGSRLVQGHPVEREGPRREEDAGWLLCSPLRSWGHRLDAISPILVREFTLKGWVARRGGRLWSVGLYRVPSYPGAHGKCLVLSSDWP